MDVDRKNLKNGLQIVINRVYFKQGKKFKLF